MQMGRRNILTAEIQFHMALRNGWTLEITFKYANFNVLIGQ